MDTRYGILIVSVTIFVLCFVGTASATNWTVNGSGGADFIGIQDAINNASMGDTIIVHSGVYYENVVVNKSVTLNGIDYPVVDAGGEGDAITLSADGITLEGFNATNTGSLWGDGGIKVTSNNNTIAGNNVCNNRGIGISLYDSSNNTITGNNVCNNSGRGISLSYSSNNNTITGNVFVNDGLSVSSSYQNTVEDNTVNAKPLVYLEDVSDCKVEDAGQVIIVNCNNVTIENIDLSNTSNGIALWKTENSKISNNTVCNNNGVGIRLWSSCNNNTITGNNVCNNNGVGIYLYSSSNNNSITGNNVCNNNCDGIRFDDSSNNTITGNNVCNNYFDGIVLGGFNNNNTITGNNVCSHNYDGISLGDSNNNTTITGNNVCNNFAGIRLFYSSSNKIYLNNFINNTDNVDSLYSPNIWNSPLEITYAYDGTTYESYLGNYWDDCEGRADADGDGIGNTPYSIDSDSDESDDYPLMMPFENYILPTSAPA